MKILPRECFSQEVLPVIRGVSLYSFVFLFYLFLKCQFRKRLDFVIKNWIDEKEGTSFKKVVYY